MKDLAILRCKLEPDLHERDQNFAIRSKTEEDSSYHVALAYLSQFQCVLQVTMIRSWYS